MRVFGSGVFAATAILVGLVAGEGCGGAAFTAAADAGGSDDGSVSDASGGDAATVDAAMQCVLPPNGVGGERAFCDFEAAMFSTCRYCDSCNQLDANDCVALGGALSATFKASLVTCQSSLKCDPQISKYAGDPCVLPKLQAAQKTSAQNAAKTAYCTACPTNVSACSSFFDFSTDASMAGLGIWTTLFSDGLSQQLVTTCSTPGTAKCDPAAYSVCAALILCGNSGAPHSHCETGLCK